MRLLKLSKIFRDRYNLAKVFGISVQLHYTFVMFLLTNNGNDDGNS